MVNDSVKRLNRVFTHLKVNPNQFAKAIGLQRTQNIYDVLYGKSNISGRLAAKIVAKYPDIDLNWLVTGQGEMVKSDDERDTRHTTQVIIGAGASANIIYHVPVQAEAGFIGGHMDPIANDELKPWTLPGFDDLGFSFKVKGPSMNPTLREDEVVVTSRVNEAYEYIKREYIYVILTEENVLIKRIKKDPKKPGVLKLISDNKEYKETEANFDEVKIYKVRRAVIYDLSKREL